MADRSAPKVNMERPRHLPNFEAPPLTEVALSLQFEKISKFGFVDIGLLWQRFRDRFDCVEYHPPLAPTFETFGLRLSPLQPLQIDFATIPHLPRIWFLDKAGNEIIQFQSDRFVHNWRKREVENVYPRYEQIRARFAAELVEFEAFLTERGLGPLVPNQCELTYVNTITVPDGVTDPSSTVFKGWKPVPAKFLGRAEDLSFSARYLINNDKREPIGRIIAQSSHGMDAEGRPIIQLMLIGRGPPATPTPRAALEFMDVAREHIVCGFAELTTNQMHKIWKRRS